MTRTILGESPAIKELLQLISKIAPNKSNVLIIGESGTGKELVARMIHDSGPLKMKSFVPVNCGAIPETLIESEMFGHKKGSFTGAVNEKLGLFEAASGGTIFLDEIGELPLSMQVKLLRAIQDRTIRKVGGTEDIRVDVRIIAATNRDLEAAVACGKFREDLYYRLNVLLVKTPPLRERGGDIRLLAKVFLDKFCEKASMGIVGEIAGKITDFDPEVMSALERYEWPGNVRELENVIERAVMLENGKTISLDAIPSALASAVSKVTESHVKPIGGEIRLPAPDFTGGNLDLDSILAEVEKIYLLNALQHARGVRKKAAELLGITFRSMRYRLKKAGVGGGEDG